MNAFYSKLIKSFFIGLLVFLLINYIDGKNFYDYHGITRSYLIGFYFYPLLLIADLINLIIPITDTLIYTILLNPLYSDTNQLPYSTSIRIGTLILGITWTSALTYIYFSLPVSKKLRTFTRICIYILSVVLLLYIASIISTEIFGTPYNRLCGGCA